MMTDRRQRICSCGAEMAITLELSERAEVAKIVWKNVYPVGDACYNVKDIFAGAFKYRVRCQMCQKNREISTFKS